MLDARVKRLESAYESARVEVNRLVAQTSEARSDFETEPDSEQAQLGLAVALGLARDSDNDELMRRARSRIGQLRSHTSTLSRSIPRLKEIERRRTEIETEAYQATDRRLESTTCTGGSRLSVLRRTLEARRSERLAGLKNNSRISDRLGSFSSMESESDYRMGDVHYAAQA